MTYFNTNKEFGSVLAKSNLNVYSQEYMILQYFLEAPRVFLARHDIEREFNLTTQSCSRALRNLTKHGLLEKQGKDEMEMGPFGKMVHVWGVAKPKGQMELF